MHAETKESALVPISTGVAVAALVLGAMAMAISPVFVRNAEVDPFASAFWRTCLGLPILFAWARLAPRPAQSSAQRPARTLRTQYQSVVLAGLFFAGDLLFWHLAVLNTSIANATFFACLAPIWVALLSGLTIGERVARETFRGLAVCLAGAALLIFHSTKAGGGRWVGDLYGLATSFFFGLYFLAVRTARRGMGAGETAFLSTLVTAVLLLVVALAAGEALLPPSLAGAANLVGLGVVSHAGGQGLLAIALGVLSASFSSLVIFLEAIAAAIFGWIFAGETLSPLQLAGGLLVLVGLSVARPRAAPVV